MFLILTLRRQMNKGMKTSLEQINIIGTNTKICNQMLINSSLTYPAIDFNRLRYKIVINFIIYIYSLVFAHKKIHLKIMHSLL